MASICTAQEHLLYASTKTICVLQLALKGSNYAGLLERHRIHTKNVEHVVDSLR